MKRFLVPAVMILTALAWTVSPACADVVLTVTNGASPGTFTVTSSGSTQSDGTVDVVNHSSYVISQLAVTSSISSTFTNFDGDGPFTGGSTYNGPNQTFSNINGSGTFADVNFTGATIYGPLGLAPGATGYFGVEGPDAYNSFTFPTNAFSATVTQATPIPEPGTMMIFGLGLAGLAGYRLRRKQSA